MLLDAVSLAQELVRFPSLNPPGEEKACVEFVARHLEEIGFSVEAYEFGPDRPSLVARLPGSANLKPLVFTGHLDVVPVGAAPWRFSPFDAVVAEAMLHGRGSCDMKSGIAAFIAAAARLRAAGAVFRRGLTFVITAGEETGCQGAFDLARRGVLGEAELLIVAEPTSNKPVIAHKGSLRVTVTTRGRTAHSSMPHEGDNAISKAVAWISRLEAHRFETIHPLLGRTTAVTTTITGGQNINSVPDSASFTVDFRTLPDDNHAEILAWLGNLFDGQAEIQLVTDFKGFSTEPADATISPLFDVLAKLRGRAPSPTGAPYFTDASALVPAFAGVPTVVIGPGEPSQCHKTDEHCPINDIVEATGIYEQLMQKICL